MSKKNAFHSPKSSAKRKNSKISKASNVRRRDPFLARETDKYSEPLPSREFVLQTLAEHGVPLNFESLVHALEIHDAEREPFERRLRAMERDGQIMRNRSGAFILPDKLALIRGKVEGHPEGYGFLIPEDGGGDIFLGPKAMRQVLHGDRALVRVAGLDNRGRREGIIVEVLERANTRLVGRVLIEHGVAIVAAENRRINQDILLVPDNSPSSVKPTAGQVVIVELVSQPTAQTRPVGRIVETLGNYADSGMEIEIALRKYDLPFEFSEPALAEARALPAKVMKKDWAGRVDLTSLPLVTIDGETAKDFDDAVYCEKQGRGYRLIVAIADVSHYVQPGSVLDREAYARGNSVYFPRRVIPMLPEKISNGLCSLNPQVERLCMACDMAIDARGEIKKYEFYPAVMFSHARLTYTVVAQALYDKEPTALEKVGDLLPQLENLETLFRVLLKARAKRGAIDFESIETRMIFDEDGKIERIVPESRNDAHRIIEECMLAANVCASQFLQEHEHPVLYRIHEGPTPEKLLKLRDFLAEFGFGIGGGDDPHASDYAKVIEKIKGRPDANLLQTVMLRSLRQAVYSPDNVGHFGLAYDAYTHFTSPIRRYPDLLVHRAIKAALQRKRYKPHIASNIEGVSAAENWDDIGLHCSTTERRADEASRDVESWLKCWFMQDRVGEVYSGNVTAVVPFGIFVTLDELFVEGLVHVSELGQDYFHFDESRHEMVGERTGRRFRLSDRVNVQIVRVDLETRKIDFRLVTQPAMPGTSNIVKTAPKAPVSVPSVETVSLSVPQSKNKPARKKKSVEPIVEEAPKAKSAVRKKGTVPKAKSADQTRKAKTPAAKTSRAKSKAATGAKKAPASKVSKAAKVAKAAKVVATAKQRAVVAKTSKPAKATQATKKVKGTSRG